MIEAQDEILMAEHLAVHRSRIEILEGRPQPDDEEVAVLLETEQELLGEHVRAMQTLLQGRQPYPPGRHGDWPSFLAGADQHRRRGVAPSRSFRSAGERQGAYARWGADAVENLWMARQFAIENLRSGLEMSDETAQSVHIGMALDQVEMARRWTDLADRGGYMRPAPPSLSIHRTVEDDYARPALAATRSAERWRR